MAVLAIVLSHFLLSLVCDGLECKISANEGSLLEVYLFQTASGEKGTSHILIRTIRSTLNHSVPYIAIPTCNA